MRRLTLCSFALTLFALFAPSARAQTVTGNLTAADNGACVKRDSSQSNGCLAEALPSAANNVSVTTTGTFVATYVIEGQAPISGAWGAISQNYAGTQSLSLPTPGLSAVRIRVVSYTSGTIAATLIVSSGGSGSGTVTNVSVGNLSPLFTSSVAAATTTPSISYTLTNAAQNSVYAGPASGGAGVPSFQTAPTLSAANMTGLPIAGLSGLGTGVATALGEAVSGTGSICLTSGSSCGGGGGSGTVTSFSAGTLSPLFTTSVATATTTPALTFSLSNAAQNSVFAGPATGGAGAPSYQTAPTFSAANLTNFPTFNQSTTGNASTATNLATYPTLCSGGQFSEGYSSGSPPTNNCATPSGSGLPSGGVFNQQLVNNGTAGQGEWSSPSTPVGNGGSAISLASSSYTAKCDSSTAATGIQDRGAWLFVGTGGSNDVILPDLSGTGCTGMFGGVANATSGSITIARQTSDTFTVFGPSAGAASTGQTSFTLTAGQWATYSPDPTSTVYDVRIFAPASGTGTVTSATIAGTSNQVTASGTCTITTTGTCTLSLPNTIELGTDGSAAGQIQLSNSAASAHTILGSAATANNTVDFFAAVPTNLHLFYCVVTSTICTFTDAGYAYNAIPNADLANNSITIAGTSVALGGSTSSLPSPGAIGGTTPAAITGTVVTANTSLAINGGTTLTGENGSDTKAQTGTGTFSASNMGCGDANGGITPCTTTPTGLVLGNGVTATTQTAGDNSTKVATDAYVNTVYNLIQTSGSPYTMSAISGIYWNNTASAYSWDLPTPVAGLQICVGNYQARATAQSLIPGSGVTIYFEGVAGTAGSGTGLVSGGAAGDFICLEGTSSTTYMAIGAGYGTWTNH